MVSGVNFNYSNQSNLRNSYTSKPMVMQSEYDSSSKSSVNVSKKFFGKDVIDGQIGDLVFSIQKQNIFNAHHSQYSGTVADKLTSFGIKRGWNIIKPDTISGNIGNNEINLSIKKNIRGDATITGEYAGDSINLTLKKSAFGNKYTLVGDNTNYTISDKMFSYNMDTKGSFEYSEELLPILYAYTKEALDRNQQEDGAMLFYTA